MSCLSLEKAVEFLLRAITVGCIVGIVALPLAIWKVIDIIRWMLS